MKEIIKKYIVEKILDSSEPIDYQSSLYNSELITSMGHLKLIQFLERKFNISLPMSEISIENFDTIESIEQFILKKVYENK
jgi:acyl carrier protein